MKTFTWQDESKPEKYMGYKYWWRGQNSKLVIFGIKDDNLSLHQPKCCSTFLMVRNKTS